MGTIPAAPVDDVRSAAYRIPTASPESDGTLEWRSTTLVTAEVRAAGETGFGYTYADGSTSHLIRETLGPLLIGRDALATAACWDAMVGALRNLGTQGIGATAVSALDAALWDLKGRLFGQPVVTLLGAAREAVPLYGSGGFTSYTDQELGDQLASWAAQGIGRVKMKVGREPRRDIERVRAARTAIGPDTELYVDANGAHTAQQALRQAWEFGEQGVTWFEEPVPSQDLEGLERVRAGVPPGMDIAAGEYGYDVGYFKEMLQAGAVDVLQADATRCGGITGFLRAGALSDAFGIPLSAHCAPALHLHACCSIPSLRHQEWFFDHVRIEERYLDGAARPDGGLLRPDLSRPGLGLAPKRQDLEPYTL